MEACTTRDTAAAFGGISSSEGVDGMCTQHAQLSTAAPGSATETSHTSGRTHAPPHVVLDDDEAVRVGRLDGRGSVLMRMVPEGSGCCVWFAVRMPIQPGANKPAPPDPVRGVAGCAQSKQQKMQEFCTLSSAHRRARPSARAPLAIIQRGCAGCAPLEVRTPRAAHPSRNAHHSARQVRGSAHPSAHISRNGPCSCPLQLRSNSPVQARHVTACEVHVVRQSVGRISWVPLGLDVNEDVVGARVDARGRLVIHACMRAMCGMGAWHAAFTGTRTPLHLLPAAPGWQCASNTHLASHGCHGRAGLQ